MLYLLTTGSWLGACCFCEVNGSTNYSHKAFGPARNLIECLTFSGWLASMFSLNCRNREIKRIKDGMQRGNSFAFLCHDINELEHSNQVILPRVSVVMPLKGFGEHNLHNWRTQVRETIANSNHLILNFYASS